MWLPLDKESKGVGLWWLQAALATLLLLPTLAFAAPPSNDDCANARSLVGLTASATDSNLEATLEAGESTGHGDRTLWYTWTPDVDADVTIDTQGTNFSAALIVFQGDAIQRLNNIGAQGHGNPNRVSFRAVAGVKYLAVVGTLDGSQTNHTVVINVTAGARGGVAAIPPAPLTTNTPVNDNAAQAQELPNTQSNLVAVNYTGTATREGGEGDTGERTVWYKWTAPANVMVTVSGEGSQYGQRLIAYLGTPFSNFQRVAVDAPYNDTATITFPATAGTTF
jgi:hypothetical protein